MNFTPQTGRSASRDTVRRAGPRWAPPTPTPARRGCPPAPDAAEAGELRIRFSLNNPSPYSSSVERPLRAELEVYPVVKRRPVTVGGGPIVPGSDRWAELISARLPAGSSRNSLISSRVHS
jgi:hypothetical protein